MFKVLTVIAVICFIGWRIKAFFYRQRLLAQGQAVPEPRGPKPITVIGFGLVAIYGGYLLWVLIERLNGG